MRARWGQRPLPLQERGSWGTEANNSWAKSMLGNPLFALKLRGELMDSERPAAATDAGSLHVACIGP